MEKEVDFTFGSPTEQAEFASSHRLFLERFTNLKTALEIAFLREATTSARNDLVIFFLGRLSVEDFMEIVLLCANGYGTGGMKLLRGLYERVVTARYLHSNPAQVDDFLDFHWISQYKIAQEIEDAFGKGTLSDEQLEQLKSKRDEVRHRFMVSDCKKCGTQRQNHTWSKLDFVSMARTTGATGNRIVDAYYLPTEQAHSTIGAVLKRLTEKNSGVLSFASGSQRKTATTVLISSHNLIVDALDLQKQHFALEALEKPLQRCIEDFQEIWSDRQ